MADKIKKINSKIAPVLEAFLANPEYQETFKDMAFALGYSGDDTVRQKEILFTANDDGEIGFVLAELNEMFYTFQLTTNLLSQEPFASLVELHPEKKDEVIAFAKRASKGEEITNDDVTKLLTPNT